MPGDFFYHPHSWKRNLVTAWSGLDSIEEWQKHISNHDDLEKLKHFGWYPFVDIEYRYNSCGFRDDEFSDEPCGLAIGCSFTLGIGVALSQSWPKQLEQMLGIKVWNLGIGGASISTCYRVMEFFLPRLRPKFVAMLDPPIARLEVCSARGDYTNLLPSSWQYTYVTSPQDQFLRHWFAQDQNWIHQHRVHVRAMQCMAQEFGIQFVHLYNGCIVQPDPAYQEPKGLLVDYGRDLAHAGPETLKRTAKIIYNLLDSDTAA
jgi:hypothetical protein